MAITRKVLKEKEYLLSIDEFKTPRSMSHQQAIASLLLRLILLNPGADPLHPEMGVGITRYRYAMGKLEELKRRVADQIQTYLPDYPAGKVDIEITEDRLCNIMIYIDDNVYVYDSTQAPVPISIDSALEPI